VPLTCFGNIHTPIDKHISLGYYTNHAESIPVQRSPKRGGFMPNQTPFNYTWRLTKYCYSELDNFINCADGIKPEDLQRRYCDFTYTINPHSHW
jgi:hypothetical protein